MAKKKKAKIVVPEKSEEQIQEEIQLRGELESSLARLDGEDLLPVLDTSEIDGVPQINRILRVFESLEREIKVIEYDNQNYVEYNNGLIEKKKQQMSYLANVMCNWMNEDGDRKTIKTTNGTLRMTTRKKVHYGDVIELMSWCRHNDVKGGIRIKEELNKKVLNEYVKTTGDAPDEELYSITEESSFSVTTNKKTGEE